MTSKPGYPHGTFISYCQGYFILIQKMQLLEIAKPIMDEEEKDLENGLGFEDDLDLENIDENDMEADEYDSYDPEDRYS